MYYSPQQFHAYLQQERYIREEFNCNFLNKSRFAGVPSLNEVKVALKDIKRRITERDRVSSNVLFKFYRPWHVVPALKNFQAPVGDYAIGVEVEKGFVSLEAVRKIANVIKNWRYITLDNEGGEYPLEVTFPPILLSKFGRKSQVSRYLDLLSKNSELLSSEGLDEETGEYGESIKIGCHINVSKGGFTCYDRNVVRDMYDIIQDGLTYSENEKYFNRQPYCTIMNNQGHYLEFKMFNTTNSYEDLKRYINISVALTDLICDAADWFEYGRAERKEKVVQALELGYNKR